MYRTKKLQTLIETPKNIFTTKDLGVLWDIQDKNTLWTTIKRYVADAKLYRVKKGVYSKLPLSRLSDYEVACTLCGPLSYITLETVLSKAGAMFQNITPVVLAGQKSQTIKYGDKIVRCKQLKPEYLVNRAGIEDKETFSQATPERALADLLYYKPKYYLGNPLAVDQKKVQEIRKTVYNPSMQKLQNKYVGVDQNIRFGKPVIKGTRITVADILGLVEAGYSVNEIPAQYQNITLPMAKNAISYAKDILGK